MQQPKYICVTVNGIILQIAKHTEIKNLTEGVLEVFLPDDSELERWGEKESEDWTLSNNKRMKAICKFLNDNNL